MKLKVVGENVHLIQQEEPKTSPRNTSFTRTKHNGQTNGLPILNGSPAATSPRSTTQATRFVLLFVG